MRTSMVAVFGLAILLAAPSVFAQERIVADVPFDFILSNKVMPAGQYSVTWPGRGSEMAVIRHSGTNRSVGTLANPARTPRSDEEPALVFYRYGKTHYLKRVRTNFSERQFPKSRGEKELLAARVVPQQTTVAAREFDANTGQ